MDSLKRNLNRRKLDITNQIDESTDSTKKIACNKSSLSRSFNNLLQGVRRSLSRSRTKRSRSTAPPTKLNNTNTNRNKSKIKKQQEVVMSSTDSIPPAPFMPATPSHRFNIKNINIKTIKKQFQSHNSKKVTINYYYVIYYQQIHKYIIPKNIDRFFPLNFVKRLFYSLNCI
jgi:hypothetical protein